MAVHTGCVYMGGREGEWLGERQRGVQNTISQNTGDPDEPYGRVVVVVVVMVLLV